MESKIILRILKEIQEVNEGDEQLKDQIYLQAMDDADIRKLQGFIRGPPGTPYENGIFNLKIVLPKEYPFKPPLVNFMTKIYHPNIQTSSGYICLDVLASAWTPTMTLKSMLLSLQLLLQDPRPDDPLEQAIARQLRTDRETFDRTAFFWTGEHALTTEERTDEWKRMNAMVLMIMKRRNMKRASAISTLSRQKWKEVTRKRRRDETVPGEENGGQGTETSVAATTTRAENQNDQGNQHSDDDDGLLPDHIRLISAILSQQIDLRGEAQDDEDDD